MPTPEIEAVKHDVGDQHDCDYPKPDESHILSYVRIGAAICDAGYNGPTVRTLINDAIYKHDKENEARNKGP